eukprot:CAMPEP_0168366950 /NCGR_PEP_ID=MMETSP0228-20121227/5488_1 /TAXON_ID=133427 /ORGANISM="Protoceratium reticulatum, Strain CCCM 535 (=CCMP 1889)" /LENGTH=149 /DNA_ID=CAMNT_0008379759 /DNA_START=37 /DNA_END=483 /DNA_ORIENTATION=+
MDRKLVDHVSDLGPLRIHGPNLEQQLHELCCTDIKGRIALLRMRLPVKTMDHKLVEHLPDLGPLRIHGPDLEQQLHELCCTDIAGSSRSHLGKTRLHLAVQSLDWTASLAADPGTEDACPTLGPGCRPCQAPEHGRGDASALDGPLGPA